MRVGQLQATLLIAASAIAPAMTARAETNVELSSGVNYSSGNFGGTEDTNVVVVPLSVRVKTGNWSFRASLPYVSVDGPADVSVVLDDNNSGRGSGGSGGSGRDHPEDDGSISGTVRDGSVSGIGDLSLSGTYAFNDIGDSALYIDLTGRVRIPTGDEDKGLGVGATDYGLATEVGFDLDGGGVFATLGRRFLGSVDGIEREDGWQAGLGGWWDASEKTSLGLGYDWREATTSGGEDPREVYGYVTYRATDAWRIGFNASAGLNDASPDYGVGVSLTWHSQDRR